MTSRAATRAALALASAALALCACGGAVARTAAVADLGPCGLRASPPAAWRHVVWIWLENESYAQVIGSENAPFLTTLAHECGIAADYSATAHPSLPNYLAATSGSTWGITDDDPPSSHPIHGRSIFGQVAAAGLTWRSFEESMPRPCDPASSGAYAVKHNPAVYFVGIRRLCSRWDLPLTALRVGALPAFAFVTPNLCHDMHSCPVATGDAWLRRFVSSLVRGRSYRAGDTVVFVTFDEGTDAANHVATVIVSPSTRPGTVSTARFDHGSLLRTTEQLLGLPRLGAGTSMARAFDLSPPPAGGRR
jgi:hypothetical protein